MPHLKTQPHIACFGYKFAFGWRHKPPPIKIMDKFIINCGLKNTFRLTTNRKEVTLALS